MNYYSAPEDAMDSIHAMAPWARMALQAALIAKNSKKMPKKAAKKTTRAKTPRAAG
jgi:DNA transformation protein